MTVNNLLRLPQIYRTTWHPSFESRQQPIKVYWCGPMEKKGATTFGLTTFSILAFCMTTFSITITNATLSTTILSIKWHHTECCYAERRVFIVMLSVIIPCVIMLRVVEPKKVIISFDWDYSSFQFNIMVIG